MLAEQMRAGASEHDGKGHYAVANWLFLRIVGLAYVFAFARSPAGLPLAGCSKARLEPFLSPIQFRHVRVLSL